MLMTQPQLISSRHNPQFKRWISLRESHGVKTHQQCLVAGKKLRKEMAQDSTLSTCEIVFPQSYEITEELLPQATYFALTRDLFDELDVFGTKEPLLIYPTPPIPRCDLTQPPVGLEVLCPISF